MGNATNSNNKNTNKGVDGRKSIQSIVNQAFDDNVIIANNES